MSAPRKPGSQVAPNQRPYFSDGRTASTHTKIPIDQLTAGKRYRVRDKDWAVLWGDDLSWVEANKLKETVVGQRKSRTARVEDMAIPPPDWWVQEQAQGPAADVDDVDDDLAIPDDDSEVTMPGTRTGSAAAETTSARMPNTGTSFELAGDAQVTVPAKGVVHRIPDGHELLVNGQVMPVPTSVAAGDVVQARAVDPVIIAARARAMAAVRPVVAQSQARAPKYRDITVKAPQPRKGPPPRDRTVSKQPVLVRLGAAPSAPAPRKEDVPLSPLKVATQQDGEALPDDAMTDEDLPDLASDLHGGATDGDLEYARKQREREEAERQRAR